MIRVPYDILNKILTYVNTSETSIFRLSCRYFYNISENVTNIYYSDLINTSLIDWAKGYSKGEIWSVNLSKSVAKDVKMLQYISDPNEHINPCKIDSSVYYTTITKGYLDSLIWLTSDLQKFTLYEKGNTRGVKLRAIHHICETVAKYGHVHILEYIFDKNRDKYHTFIQQDKNDPCDWKYMPLVQICDTAAKYGQALVMKWSMFYFMDIGDENRYSVYMCAIKNGHINVLEILDEYDKSTDGFCSIKNPPDEAFLQCAIQYDKLETLIWLWNKMEKNSNIVSYICGMISVAITKKNRRIIEWLKPIVKDLSTRDRIELIRLWNEYEDIEPPQWILHG